MEFSESILFNFLDHYKANDVPLPDFISEQINERLKNLSRQYQEEPHPFITTEAFMLSHAAGLPVPGWVIDWMHKGLEDYYRTDGKAGNLQELLGFTSKQRTGTLFDAKHLEVRNTEHVFQVLLLHHICMIPIDIAKTLVLESHNTTPGVSPLDFGSFNKYYLKRVSKIFEENREILLGSVDLFGQDPSFPLNILFRYIPVALESKIMSRVKLMPIIAELVTRAGIVSEGNSVKYAVAALDMIIRNPAIVKVEQVGRLPRINVELSKQFPPLEN
jgi:hypothetical protein